MPPDPGGWSGTRIAKQGMLRQKSQQLKEQSAGQFIMERAGIVYKRINSVSSRQSQRIADTVRRRNPERALRSGSFEAWLDDERIRWENKGKY